MNINVNREAPILTAQRAVEDRGGFGLSLCMIDVEDSNGVTARFWVETRVVRGRQVLTIRTKNKNDKETVKFLRGSFNRL